MTNRTAVLKTYLSPEESAAFHRACSAEQVTRAEKLREFCNGFARTNDRLNGRRKEGPKPPRHKAQFPGRQVSYGVVPCMRIRV